MFNPPPGRQVVSWICQLRRSAGGKVSAPWIYLSARQFASLPECIVMVFPAALGSPGLSDGVYRAETAIDGYLDGDDHAQQPDRGHRDPPALARAALRAARGRGRCRQVARRPGLGARVHVPERRRRLGRRRRPPLPAVGLLGRPRRHAGQARPAGQRNRACCRRRCRI
jgi:hypothetical protein